MSSEATSRRYIENFIKRAVREDVEDGHSTEFTADSLDNLEGLWPYLEYNYETFDNLLESEDFKDAIKFREGEKIGQAMLKAYYDELVDHINVIKEREYG